MQNALLNLSETADFIASGAVLAIAGPQALLSRLPRGRWIGGTAAEAHTDQGRLRLEDRLFVTRFDAATDADIRYLPKDALPALAAGYRPGGATVVLIPALSAAHGAYALGGAGYPKLFDQPVMGWIAAADSGPSAPAVFDGMTGLRHDDGAVALHLALPDAAVTHLDIVNGFAPLQGDRTTFTFAKTGFTATEAMVSGETVALARHLRALGIDTRQPLVADRGGAWIATAFHQVDDESGTVSFHSPVIAGVEYRLGTALLPLAPRSEAGACTCHCLSQQENSPLTADLPGPVTFGQIAYVLLNQTTVTLRIDCPA